VVPTVIRAATHHDLPALGTLGALLMRVHNAFDQHRFLPPGDAPEDGYAWFLGTQLRERDVAIFVAEIDGIVQAYVYAALEPLSWKELRGPAGFIHDIVVADSARRSGVATQLLEAARAWLAERGAPRVMLWTAAQNHAAISLFAGLGFRQTMIEMTLELEGTADGGAVPSET
jgi:ribosomal protein S18 acetylase RimI-like enzyme